jgi:mono/diheme cytochrome c family protein
MPELAADAPNLTGIGARLNTDWLARWLVKPSALRPTATMPAVFGHDSVKAAVKAKDSRPWDVAAYLSTLTGNAPSGTVGDAVAGGKLFDSLGCIACHQAPDKPIAADDKLNRIPLSGVKAKFKPQALVAFLKDPTTNYKWVRMPHFGLSDKEAGDLAALLLKHSAEPDIVADAPKGDVAQGKRLVAEMGCMNCHSGPDKTSYSAPSFTALAGTDWAAKGCAAPADKRGNSPHLNLADDDRKALATFGRTDGGSLKAHSPAEFADRQIKQLNCAACHVYNGAGNDWDSVAMESKHFAGKNEHKGAHLDQSRPKISNAGDKLNTDWLQHLLEGKVKPKPRPWLAARMPAFPSRAAALASGMAAEHGVAPCSADKSAVKQDVVASGKQLLGPNGGFACIICHAVGSQKAVAPFESQGLNLMLANERLRENYYMRWMLDPPRIDHATKMPKYAAEDGTTPLADVLGGDANAQFNAVWEFLKAGRKVPPTQ